MFPVKVARAAGTGASVPVECCQICGHGTLDTALSLQVQEAADLLAEDLRQLEAALSELAVRHKYTLTIGRTHGIQAEPTTFGHKVAVFVAQVRRDRVTT